MIGAGPDQVHRVHTCAQFSYNILNNITENRYISLQLTINKKQSTYFRIIKLSFCLSNEKNKKIATAPYTPVTFRLYSIM